jgi:hypothetical protein
MYNNKNNYYDNEIQRMWNTQCVIIPVISRTTRIVTKDKCESQPEKHPTDSPQKTAALGTSYIPQKVLQQSDT